MSVIDQQFKYLNSLQEVYSKKPILIKIKEGDMPAGSNPELYLWLPYKENWRNVTEPIYTRSILPNELMFDPDVKNWDVLVSGMKLIKAFCERENIPVQFAYSGGNGIHGHIFFNSFPIDQDIFDSCKKYDIDLFKVIRNALIDIIFNQSGANRQSLGLDTKKINFGMGRMGSMVREYGTTRKDGNFKTLITSIPDKKPEKGSLPLVFPDGITGWNIPQKYYAKINETIRAEIKKSIDSKNFNFEAIDLKGNKIEKFPCLKTLFKMGATDGNRYYGACSIALMAKQCGYSWQGTEELIQKFFSKCSITPQEINERIDNCKPMYDSADYHFSCRTLKETFGSGICEFSNCLMCEKVKALEDKKTPDEAPEHIKEAARKIQEAGNPIPFIMQTFGKMHIGDEMTAKAILAGSGAQAVLNSHGIQPKVSAGSGKGKSHAVSCALHLMPPEYILETSLSGKALFHSDDLKPGTIIFSDDTEPDENLQEVIKRSSTNFQKETKHRISVKDGSEWTTKESTIPPRIMWVLTSVMDNGGIEYLNRQFNLSVDETPEQDKKVEEFEKMKAAMAEVDLPVNDDVLICREIIRDIKSKLWKVKITYAQNIEWNDTENRRNLSQFLDLIMAFAVFDYKHRPKPDETTIEANEEDFKMALSMYSTRAANQKLKLNDTEIKVLGTMKKDQPYTNAQLQQLTGKSHTTIQFMFHGRPGKGNGGLLSKIPFLEYHPETDFIGGSEIAGEGSYEHEVNITKKTKPKQVYVLTVDFQGITSFGSIASLKPSIN